MRVGPIGRLWSIARTRVCLLGAMGRQNCWSECGGGSSAVRADCRFDAFVVADDAGIANSLFPR